MKADKIITKALAIVFAAIIAVGFLPAMEAQASQNIRVYVNDRRVNFPDQQPIIIDGRIFVPLSGVFEELGFTASRDTTNELITLTNGLPSDGGLINIMLSVGNRNFLVRGFPNAALTQHIMEAAPQLINGRVMVPLRAIAESIGHTATWNSTAQRARITTTGYVLAGAANDSSHLPVVAGVPGQSVIGQWIDAWPGLTDFERYVFQFVNEYRVENGLDALSLCPVLSALAWYRTSYLNRSGFIRANAQSGDVHSWGSHRSNDIANMGRVSGGGVSGGINFVARNAHMTTYEQARSSVNGWIASPPHRQNMLFGFDGRGENTIVGIGSALSVNGRRTYVYAFFGIPLQ